MVSTTALDGGPRAREPRDGGPRVRAEVAFDAGVDGGLDGGLDGGVPVDGGGDGGLAGLASFDAGPPIDGSAEALEPELPLVVPEAQDRAVRTLLGLVALLALAWIGSHPRVQKLEERLGIAQLATTGLPFVVLGVIARAPGVDILNPEVILAITPLLQFGLGWIGFHTGFQFEATALDATPKGTGSAVILLTGGSFLAIALAAGVTLYAFDLGSSMRMLARDAAIIGLAGALSAPTIARVAGRAIPERALELSRIIGVLDDVVGVGALAVLFAWLHPVDHGWQLPGVGWLFVTFGMSVALGLVMYAVLRVAESPSESTSLLLGSVAFTAGMASVFALPPLVVCFFAGMLLKNLPGADKPRLAAAFARLERPIYLVFLVVVGALWRVDDWHGWVLLFVFVLARVLGRWLAVRAARRLPEESRHRGLEGSDDWDLAAPPMGVLALAFVLTAQTLYASPGIQMIVTAVIGGVVTFEAVVQLGARLRRAPKVRP